MAFDPKLKQRDKQTLDRKKARLREKKQRWRETHGLERDDAALVRSAFSDVRSGLRAPSSNPFASPAAPLRGEPKAVVAAAEAVFLAAVRGGCWEVRWHAPLLAIASWHSRWRRSPANRQTPPQTKPAGIGQRQFRSLLAWLFADYDVPPFLAEPFEAVNARPKAAKQLWYIDVAQGPNLRRCKGLPIPLTSRMAHHVMLAPHDLSLGQAFRWGQTLGLGGDETWRRQ